MMLDLDEAGYITLRRGRRGDARDRTAGRRPTASRNCSRPSGRACSPPGDVRADATKRVSGAVGDGALAVRFAHEVLQA